MSSKYILPSFKILYTIFNCTAIRIYILNDSPQPQRSVSLGFLNTKVDNAVKKTLLLGEFRKIAGGSDKLNDIHFFFESQANDWVKNNGL